MLVLKSQMEKVREYWLNSKSHWIALGYTYLVPVRGLPNGLEDHWCAGFSSICQIIHRNGLTRKKVQEIALQRLSVCRGDFMAEVQWFSPDKFVWVDETGSNKKDQVRRCGYALRGEYPVSSLPQIPASWTAYICHCSTICWWCNCIRIDQGNCGWEQVCGFYSVHFSVGQLFCSPCSGGVRTSRWSRHSTFFPSSI